MSVENRIVTFCDVLSFSANFAGGFAEMCQVKVLVTVKFKEDGLSGPVFRVLVVDQCRLPSPDLGKSEQLEMILRIIAEDSKLPEPTRRVYWGIEGVKTQIAQYRSEIKGLHEKERVFEFFEYYPDGRPVGSPNQRRLAPTIKSQKVHPV